MPLYVDVRMPRDGIAGLLSSLSIEPNRRGKEFEKLCRWYLLSDPVYRAQLSRVWLWKEWPGRWGNDEAGIDLVAETREGKLWAVQAKAYDPNYSVKKADVDSFLSESARPEFSYRLLIASTNKLARHAVRAMHAQEKPVGQLLLHDLERADVAWPASISDLRPAASKPKEPRPHQRAAIDAIVAGFAEADRGQVIMACGTGKTLVALWCTEALEAERTLVLVPSLSLLRQTIQEWLVNSSREFEFLPVCSDDTVRDHDQVVASVAELGFPATGDPQAVREFLRRPGPRVVFSTYQSSPVVASALESAGLDFDLAIADEAHRCAGPAASDFATILDDDRIRVKKRIFMTATPRYFAGKLRKASADDDFEIVSMDDDERFGSVFHRLSFGDAIKRDLLSDYRVLVIGVDDEEYLNYAKKGLFVTRDGEEVTDARSLAAQIGIIKAIRKYDLRRVITFHSRVKSAEKFSKSLQDVVDWLPREARPSGHLWAEHVSGEMNAAMRETRLRRLREVEANTRGVLSNARCLSEGVDVPALDGVAFVDPKKSAIDIAQAVGRAIRKSEEKELGTIVIPVFIKSGDDAEVALDGSAFKPVWDVVRALREHDSELAEALDDLRRGLGSESTTRLRLPSKLVIDLPRSINADFARAFDVHLVESCTASFEHWFGLLIQYVDREGDAIVPAGHIEFGSKLGTWVANQRQAYRLGKLEAEQVARLETLTGWTWSPQQSAWEAGIAALAVYVEREGDAGVPQFHVESGFTLGNWVSTQRAAHKSELLEAERVARLAALPGWTWDTYQAAWGAGIARLTGYVERQGDARVRRKHVESGFGLGIWVVRQRQLYKSGRLDVAQVAGLEALPGWTWNPEQADWEAGFAALNAYVEREGDARVRHRRVESGLKLGVWVNTQRTLYKREKLEPERVARLEALPGWTWDPDRAAWEAGFAALTAYVEREGDAAVPQRHAEAEFKLGTWVNTQRQIYKSGKLKAERVTRLEALPGWAWDTMFAAWEACIAVLATYIDREGDARVPQSHVESGFRLGAWIGNRRQDYKSGELEPDRVAWLEALPGWSWNTNEAAWDAGFAVLAAYIDREGDARVPQSHVESGFKLGNWVANRLQDYKSEKLEAEKVAQLEAIPGWTWNRLQAGWDEGFAVLTAYVEREGDARVPLRRVESGLKLGVWVNTQRKSYKSEKLERERVVRLEALPGWAWGPKQDDWEAGIAALGAYIDREGDARVPQRHVESGFTLGNWVANRLQDYKSEKLEAEKVARLEELRGWTWNPRQAAWEEGFAALAAYVERERDTRVPQSHVESGFRLGNWVYNQRQRYKSEKLAPERVARLEALSGWYWKARN